MTKRNLTTLAIVTMIALLPSVAFAADAAADGGWTNMAKAILLGLVATGGAIAQGRAASSALEGICRNPNAASTVTTPMILGLSFIESLVIFALVVVFTM